MSRPWTGGEDALLGISPDGAIAIAIGRSRAAVRERRLILGIPPRGRGVAPGEPLDHELRVRVTAREFSEIAARAAEVGASVSVYVRRILYPAVIV